MRRQVTRRGRYASPQRPYRRVPHQPIGNRARQSHRIAIANSSPVALDRGSGYRAGRDGTDQGVDARSIVCPKLIGHAGVCRSRRTAGRLLSKTLSARGLPSIRGASQLQFLGENNLANRAAVENLLTMGQRPPRFLSFGKSAALGRLLPGVDIDVLGPPTAKQSAAILKQRHEDPDEFWHLHANFWKLQGDTGAATAIENEEVLFKEMKTGLPPIHARWLANRMDRLNVKQTLQIVRILDRALNNTSLILLFRIGKKSFLFPGDAQIENWLYALSESKDAKKICRALAKTDFYKVGHHGSLNATPKRLWELFDKKSDDRNATDRLKSVVSTRSGVHGSRQRGTEVPRTKLVEALKENSHFHSTQRKRRMWFDLEWDNLD